MTEIEKDIINTEQAHLTNKKEHTRHKIQYVSEYVRQWLYVACNKDNDNINFIDCMSNAGIYLDGEYCTAVEVLKVFIEFANEHKDKKFNILLNDNDPNKIRIAKIICSQFSPLPNNIHLYFDIEDVNVYIAQVKSKYKLFDYPSMTILFVDPFDFRTVLIPQLKSFILSTYCEVIFNLFTSDFVRNGVDAGIAKSLGGNYKFNDKNDLWEYIARELTVGNMQYCLSYPFRNINNTELYQIMFVTPHPAGLEKLKQAIWNTFNGVQYYRTKPLQGDQMSLFSVEDDKDMMAKQYASEAFELIKSKYKNTVFTYEEMSNYILSRSLLMSSQLIKYLIKPCMEQNKIIKQNLVKKNNYKQDSYRLNELI